MPALGKYLRPSLLLLMALLGTRQAAAEPIFDSGLATFVGTGTQFGRISRDGIASDWATVKLFPGVVGAPTARAYQTFTIDSGIYSFLQIQLDDPDARLFASAYDGAFTPVLVGPTFGLDANYLGDAGSSQPFGNPSFFQVAVPRHTSVVIAVNEINPGAGAGAGFNLLVEGFFDVDYNDITTEPDPGGGGGGGGSVPEPSSMALALTSALLFALHRRKRPALASRGQA